MGSCVLNADKEGKHNLEAKQLNLSSFVSPIKYMLIQKLKCLCEWISIHSWQWWMSEPRMFGRSTEHETTLSWRRWSAEFVSSFCLSSFSLRATLRIKMFYLQIHSNLSMSFEVRQFNVCNDLKIWHFLRFFFLIISLFSSIDLYGIFPSSLHN